MTKDIQDLAWQCLPKEARDFIKSDTATAWQLAYARIFGHHNLTSDEEPSELLFVERERAQNLIKSLKTIDDYTNGIRYCAKTLFGNKCLPDIPSAGSGAMGTTPPSSKLDVKSDKEPSVQSKPMRKVMFLPDKEPSVQGEPKFKVGDVIRIRDSYYAETLWGKTGKIYNHKDNVWYVEIDNTIYAAQEDDLQPYTEPETKEPECIYPDSGNCKWKNICDHTQCYFEPIKPETNDNMEEKELNLCELLRDYKGEKIYILSHGYMTVMGGLVGTVELEGTGEHGEVLNLMLNDDGTHIKGTEVIAFPSRTLYEKYPLDAQKAWREWAEERTPKRWRAEKYQGYYYIDFIGGRLVTLYNTDEREKDENNRYESYNYFSTKEEAEQAAEAVRKCLEEFHAKHTEK